MHSHDTIEIRRRELAQCAALRRGALGPAPGLGLARRALPLVLQGGAERLPQAAPCCSLGLVASHWLVRDERLTHAAFETGRRGLVGRPPHVRLHATRRQQRVAFADHDGGRRCGAVAAARNARVRVRSAPECDRAARAPARVPRAACVRAECVRARLDVADQKTHGGTCRRARSRTSASSWSWAMCYIPRVRAAVRRRG